MSRQRFPSRVLRGLRVRLRQLAPGPVRRLIGQARARGARRDGRSAAARIAESGAYWDKWSQGTPGDEPSYWLEIPQVRERVNERLLPGGTGDLVDRYFDQLEAMREQPLRRVLSVGCGTGGLERDIARRFPACDVVGIDISTACLAEARRAAEAAGLGQVTYEAIDAVSYLEREAAAPLLDGIFCYGVLHHMEDLEAFFAQARERLAPDGFLFAYEYVGPSRDAWTDADLAWAQRLFETVPADFHRLPRVAPPLAVEDPTEMIRSSEIEALLGRYFHLERTWALGGTVVVPLVASLRKGSHTAEPVREAIRTALDLEALLIERGVVPSHFAAYHCVLGVGLREDVREDQRDGRAL